MACERSKLGKQPLQLQRILHRVGGLVVIEIDVDRAQVRSPLADPLRPLLQRLRRIASLVRAARTVQADIGEIRRDIEGASGTRRSRKCRMPRYGVAGCGRSPACARSDCAARTRSDGAAAAPRRNASSRSAHSPPTTAEAGRRSGRASSPAGPRARRTFSTPASGSFSFFMWVMNRLPFAAKQKPFGRRFAPHVEPAFERQAVERVVQLDRVEMAACSSRAFSTQEAFRDRTGRASVCNATPKCRYGLRPLASRRDFFEHAGCLGSRIGRACDLPPDDQVVGAVAHRFGGRGDTLLVARRAARPTAPRASPESRPDP